MGCRGSKGTIAPAPHDAQNGKKNDKKDKELLPINPPQPTVAGTPGRGVKAMDLEVEEVEPEPDVKSKEDKEMEDLCSRRIRGGPDARKVDDEFRKKFEQHVVVVAIDAGGFKDDARENGIGHTVALLMKLRHLVRTAIVECGGRVLENETGGRAVAVFQEPHAALQGAVRLMQQIEVYNEGAGTRIDTLELRIGVDMGMALVVPDTLFGECVTSALRLAVMTAEPKEILVSRHLYEQATRNNKFDNANFAEQKGTGLFIVKWSTMPQIEVDDDRAEVAGALPLSPFARQCLTRFDAGDKSGRMGVEHGIEDAYGASACVMVLHMSGKLALAKKKGPIYLLAMVFKMRFLAKPLLEQHGGLVVRMNGDKIVTIFDHVIHGVECALEILQEVESFNKGQGDNINLAFAINAGTFIHVPDHNDVFGEVVDLAATLAEDVARPEEILLSLTAHADLDKRDLTDLNSRATLKSAEGTVDERAISYYVATSRAFAPTKLLEGAQRSSFTLS